MKMRFWKFDVFQDTDAYLFANVIDLKKVF